MKIYTRYWNKTSHVSQNYKHYNFIVSLLTTRMTS